MCTHAANLAPAGATGTLPAGKPLDPWFHTGTGPNGAVECLALQADSRILIAGPFTSVNGRSKTGLARLNSDGTLDQSFTTVLKGPGSAGQPTGLAVQADGRIVIVGPFTQVNGHRRHGIARLYPDGSVDRTFLDGMPGINGWVRDVRLQNNGSVLIGGKLASVNGERRIGIARLAADGSVDRRFSPAGSSLHQAEVRTMALQADGNILLGGRFVSRFGIVLHLLRLRPDGSVDPRFLQDSIGPNADVSIIQLQPDGRMVIGGIFSACDGFPTVKLARLRPDGSLDASFQSPLNARDILCCLCPLQGDALLVGGRFHFARYEQANAIAMLHPDGSLEESSSTIFMPTGYRFWVFALALQPDGRVIVGGNFRQVNGVRRRNIARLVL